MLNTTRSALKSDLKVDESIRLKIYLDTRKNWTIGVGRNLTGKGISAKEADFMLENDIDEANAALDAKHPWWCTLPAVQQRVMANLMFNMGAAKLATFVKFLAAMQRCDWSTAADELVDSDWYKQVGERGPRMIARLLGDTPAPTSGMTA